jgi:hypothetical protein
MIPGCMPTSRRIGCSMGFMELPTLGKLRRLSPVSPDTLHSSR